MVTGRVLAISCEALDDAHQAELAPHLPGGWECLALEETDDAYAGAMQAADAVVGWPPPALLAGDTRVKLLQLPSAGFEDYAQVAIAETVVCNAAGVLAPAVAVKESRDGDTCKVGAAVIVNGGLAETEPSGDNTAT